VIGKVILALIGIVCIQRIITEIPCLIFDESLTIGISNKEVYGQILWLHSKEIELVRVWN
jgi:hypothetical protein